MVVGAGERSPSWMAVSSAERSPGETAGASHEAAVDEEAVSSFVPLRCRTTADAAVGVDVVEMAATAAATLACSSGDQLPTSAASASSPSDAKTSAVLVADEAIDDTGVDAMASVRCKRQRRKEAKSRRSRKLQSVGNMLILTCPHVLHHKLHQFAMGRPTHFKNRQRKKH